MNRILTKEEWKKRKRRKKKIFLGTAVLLVLAIIVLSMFLIDNYNLVDSIGEWKHGETITETLSNGSVIRTQYLEPNEYSRPQTVLKKVNGIVIHYVGNPGTSAKANRNYFESLAQSKATKASSHFIIGLEGEILQCVPLTEIAYASNGRNNDTISIENCHPDETGKFNDNTYNSLIALTAALCVEYDLQEEDIIRHYDVNEKMCPLYYVDYPETWDTLKSDVMEEVDRIVKEKEETVQDEVTD